jgi:hypothetical protein
MKPKARLYSGIFLGKIHLTVGLASIPGKSFGKANGMMEAGHHPASIKKLSCSEIL